MKELTFQTSEQCSRIAAKASLHGYNWEQVDDHTLVIDIDQDSMVRLLSLTLWRKSV
jgi:hypothetical protein